jgi:accessory gene regulator protein AgrB
MSGVNKIQGIYVLFTSENITRWRGWHMTEGMTIVKVYLGFEVFAVVITKNVIVWDVALYGSCLNRRFE